MPTTFEEHVKNISSKSKLIIIKFTRHRSIDTKGRNIGNDF